MQSFDFVIVVVVRMLSKEVYKEVQFYFIFDVVVNRLLFILHFDVGLELNFIEIMVHIHIQNYAMFNYFLQSQKPNIIYFYNGYHNNQFFQTYNILQSKISIDMVVYFF